MMGVASTWQGFLTGLLLLAILVCDIAARPDADTTTPVAPTTQNPGVTLVKKGLEQLKGMEESALRGWYDMMKKFLDLIKPEEESLDLIIDYAQGKKKFEFPASVPEVAKMNAAFLALVCIGLVYVIVMPFAGFFFFYCRVCGKCGAKESQKQTKNINCWRTTHKFCLIVMIAFLVVPVTCMFIINEHMKQSFPSVKENVNYVFDVLSNFANTTEQEVNDIAGQELKAIFMSIQDTNNFKAQVVVPIQDDVTHLINQKRLEEITDFVQWIFDTHKNATDITNTTQEISMELENLQDSVRQMKNEANSLNCSVDLDICKKIIEALPVENLDIELEKIQVEGEFKKLEKIGKQKLENAVEKIKHNITMFNETIIKESKNLEKLESEVKPYQANINEKIKAILQEYIGELKNYTNIGRKVLNRTLTGKNSYEPYRWWTMLGISVALIIPVGGLVVGLLCGCCGHEQERHPSKRTAASNCGGYCLILSVYYIFIFAALLMLLTIALFVLGGNVEMIICGPLHEGNFEVLDQIKQKFSRSSPHSTMLDNFIPSKFLQNCSNNAPIYEALNMEAWNISEREDFKEDIRNKVKSAKFESDKIILLETADVKKTFESIDNLLSFQGVKDLHLKMDQLLLNVMHNVSNLIGVFQASVDQVKSQELKASLLSLNTSSRKVLETVNDIGKKWNKSSSALQTIFMEADIYKEKIKGVQKDLKTAEKALPEIIKKHISYYLTEGVDNFFNHIKTSVGRCEPLWVSFQAAHTVVCDFIVEPINGFWFGLGWSLFFIIPAIIFAVKLSRHYIRMKCDDDIYIHDSRETIPLEDMNRTKPFSYTNPGVVNWIPQIIPQPQNYVVHPMSNNQVRQFHYK